MVRVPFESAGDFAGRIPTAEGPFAEVPGVAVWYEVGADGGLTEGGLAGLMRSFASEHCQILRFWEAGHPVRFFGILGMDRWPTFNIADMSVVVCGILLLLSFIIGMSRTPAKKDT